MEDVFLLQARRESKGSPRVDHVHRRSMQHGVAVRRAGINSLEECDGRAE